MGIASSDKNTIRKMSEIEAVIYDRFLQKSPPTRRLTYVLKKLVSTKPTIRIALELLKIKCIIYGPI